MRYARSNNEGMPGQYFKPVNTTLTGCEHSIRETKSQTCFNAQRRSVPSQSTVTSQFGSSFIPHPPPLILAFLELEQFHQVAHVFQHSRQQRRVP